MSNRLDRACYLFCVHTPHWIFKQLPWPVKTALFRRADRHLYGEISHGGKP